MFKVFDDQFAQQQVEQEILKFWEANRIFEKSIESRDPAKNYVFYEGPPTANGAPGIHHVISRTIKDFVCRYQTMRGYRVHRKAGWDTHGLPVEIEVEKSLGIEGKEQVLAYGVDKFNQKCKESVFKYKKEWDDLTRKIGFWVDLEHPYITYENSYIETVWWILKEFWQQNLIYQGYKILPYCPRCETPLSSHEVAQGYKDVDDPSVYVKMPLANEANTYFLVWTTTPWTLISNVALALNAGMTYAKISYRGQQLILSSDRLSVIDGQFEIVEQYNGSELAGKEYIPLFSFIKPTKRAYYTILGDFVTAEEGTGIVHIAPAFGEDDYQVGLKYDLPVIHPVDKSGKFVADVTQFAGKFVKDADPEITADLKQRGLLYKTEKITHSYPHCWRCDSPLLYYARNSWYIRTTAFKDQLIAANQQIDWHPKEVGLGRFGEWLENNVDWSLSRDRFWGTPLNVWVCDQCGEMDCIGSIAELQQKSGLKKEIDLHKPYIDEVTYPCVKCGGTMRRVPEVIDCWFDSGAMPYAQWHYPFEHKDDFHTLFPAEFIAEGVDQTRGWFYSLLVLGVFLFKQSSYKTCLSIELILDKEGQKMSKSRGNTVNPFEIIRKHGADPLRWYLLTVSPPWVPTRFDEDGVIEVKRKFFGTLTNVYSFFALYANIDKFTGREPLVAIEDRPLIDRWIMSRLNDLIAQVTDNLARFEITKAARLISDFVIDDLSNWYVRRNRRRFWKPSEANADGHLGRDKLSAYQTLYHVLLTLAKLTAPFIPFLSEKLYQNLIVDQPDAVESVHLAEYPSPEQAAYRYRETALEERMDMVLRIVKIGRSLRNEHSIKVRQPLPQVLIYDPKGKIQLRIAGMEQLIKDELNVKSVRFSNQQSDLFIKKAEPLFKNLGPKFGRLVNKVSERIRSLNEAEIEQIEKQGSLSFVIEGKEFSVTSDDITIRTENRPSFVVETEDELSVALDLTLSDALIYEGLARDLVNRIQNMRKDADLKVVDRILVSYDGSDLLKKAIAAEADYIKNEVLAEKLIDTLSANDYQKTLDINGEKITVGIAKV
ncbi:MAG: isoleucine--tRNA ligase [candidate division KSB1 bacterium]|nr:isoleucine--tRNA ligase [candidate division KSB1 bacterium]MDZ7340263.1 isoleucine--tRNA ligase [candidate division KSB1 bacterium]